MPPPSQGNKTPRWPLVLLLIGVAFVALLLTLGGPDDSEPGDPCLQPENWQRCTEKAEVERNRQRMLESMREDGLLR